jgi:hypothetical protein
MKTVKAWAIFFGDNILKTTIRDCPRAAIWELTQDDGRGFCWKAAKRNGYTCRRVTVREE